MIKAIKNIFTRRNRIQHLNEHVYNVQINNFVYEEVTCKICHESSLDIEGYKLLVCPCQCRGSIKYIHPKCLKNWRTIKNNPKYCEICHSKYKVSKKWKKHMLNRSIETRKRIIYE